MLKSSGGHALWMLKGGHETLCARRSVCDSESDVSQSVFTALAAGLCFLPGRAENRGGAACSRLQCRACQLAQDSRSVFLGQLLMVSQGPWVQDGEGLLPDN